MYAMLAKCWFAFTVRPVVPNLFYTFFASFQDISFKRFLLNTVGIVQYSFVF